MNLVISSRAKKDLTKLDKATLKRIKLSLHKLLTAPETVDLRKLRGEPDKWRVRVGDYRIIMRIGSKEETIYVLRVRHRRAAY